MKNHTPFKSNSQSGQDRFAYEILVKPDWFTSGTFLDIGCSHPIEKNNTYALEQLGWHGLCVDIREDIRPMFSVRNSPYGCFDVRTADWNSILPKYGIKIPMVDYVSLDVDECSLDALTQLVTSVIRFRAITIEHDKYRRGDSLRDGMRHMLSCHGYELIFSDVKCDGLPFEDWWVDPKTVNMKVADKFRRDSMDWKEAFK